jgi:hypothetical protein
MKKSKFEEDWWDVASSEMTTGSEKLWQGWLVATISRRRDLSFFD